MASFELRLAGSSGHSGLQLTLLRQRVSSGHRRGRDDGRAAGAGIGTADAGGAVDAELLVGDTAFQCNGHGVAVLAFSGGSLARVVLSQGDDLRRLPGDQWHVVQCDVQRIAGLLFADADVAELDVEDFGQGGGDVATVVFIERRTGGDLVRVCIDHRKPLSVVGGCQHEHTGDIGHGAVVVGGCVFGFLGAHGKSF